MTGRIFFLFLRFQVSHLKLKVKRRRRLSSEFLPCNMLTQIVHFQKENQRRNAPIHIITIKNCKKIWLNRKSHRKVAPNFFPLKFSEFLSVFWLVKFDDVRLSKWYYLAQISLWRSFSDALAQTSNLPSTRSHLMFSKWYVLFKFRLK